MASNHDNKPRFVEPGRALIKAMARRAKTSHLGAFQILPEHVLLSCLAQLPREDHDAVADCSTGFRALMRSERFLKARRTEDITEEALVVVGNCMMALVSGRVWRRLAPMPAEMRIDFNNPYTTWFRRHIAAIGSELFIAGGMRSNGTCAVAVHDAVDDSWFSMPLPPSCVTTCHFAVGCAGQLFVGDQNDDNDIILMGWDQDAQEWVNFTTMPLSMGFDEGSHVMAVSVGTEIFLCEDVNPMHFSVFDVEAETWRRVDVFDGDGDWYYLERSVSIFVDGDLLHLLRPRSGSTPHNDHMAYDTVNDSWISIDGGLPRHTASSESDRILGIINHDGPSDYLSEQEKNETSSSGSVRLYRRRSDRGHDEEGLASDLPVRYDAVERALSVEMP